MPKTATKKAATKSDGDKRGAIVVPAPTTRIDVAWLRLPAQTCQVRTFLYELDEAFKNPIVTATTAGGRQRLIVTVDK